MIHVELWFTLPSCCQKVCWMSGKHFIEELQCSWDKIMFWQSVLADSFAEIKLASSKYDRHHASLLLYCGTFWLWVVPCGLWLAHVELLSHSFCVRTVPCIRKAQTLPVLLDRAIHNDISNLPCLFIVMYYRHM